MKQTREILLFSVLTFALLVTGKADASCNGNNPPTITSINPSTGFVSGGTVVTISGGSLGCVSVTFGGVSATNVTATGTTVTATSPAGAAGTVDLIVTNPIFGANANATATTQFSYITTASVPTSLVATVGDRQVSVAFTAPTSTGGSSIINYEYQLDGGSWVSANTTSGPVVITGLTNGTSYSIKLRAVNSAGNGAESAAQSSTPAATSNAPTALVATPGDGQVSIAFTAPTATGGAAITDYEYQLDGGSWVSASTTSGPVVISSLTNGTSYSIKLRAVNSVGDGAESAAVTSTPAATSDAPTGLDAGLVGDGVVWVAFQAPTDTGGVAITDYEYELDDNGTWTSASTASSPVMITGLTNGTSYSIKLRAVNSGGEGAESAAVTSTPATTPDAPTALVATPGDAQVSVAFQVPSSDGGAAITDYEYQLDGGTWTSASTTSSPVVITGLTNGTSYSIKLRAVNSELHGAESVAVSVLLGSPTSAFEEAEAEVQAIITQDATRSLNSTRSSNQRMTRGARSRFIDSRSQSEGDGAGFATRNNVPFDVDGTFDLDGARLSTKGTFFGQTGNVEGTERRLVFGNFDVQRDGDTGSTTATLTGRVAWEQMISDDTMLGYFVGGELADSNISGAFEGSQTRVAATAGGYAVRALSETLFADGFISIGAGRNNLAMADDVLALTSDYTTRTATVGGALTGVYAYERYELRPELAFSYGKTWIGDVGFTGVAYGLTDDTLSLDAGNVSIANLTLRPEIVWALDAETVAHSNAQLSFAPRLICERTTTATTTQDCGAGAEIGLSSNSEDGLSSANIRFVMDRVGNSNRSNVVFNVEHRF